MSRTPDYVESLGILTVAHRLKRLMNRLLREAELAYGELGCPMRPRWCSTLSLLDEEGPLAVSEVADRVGMSHAAVVQILDDMTGSGLVRRVRDASDGRRSLLSLSPKGRRWMPALRRVWAAQAEALEEAFGGGGAQVLALLDHVNAQLDRRGLAARIVERVDPKDLDGLPGRLETPKLP